MQLNDKMKEGASHVGALLSAATCALLAATPALANDAGDKAWRIDAGVMHYSENDRITVNEAKTGLRYQINEDVGIGVRYGYDAVSGSSPTGAVKVQSKSGASGSSYLARFEAKRQSVGLDFDTLLPTGSRLTLNGDHSTQETYESTGVGATIAHDFNNRNTTLVAGMGYSVDTVQPKAGLHYGMGWVSEGKVWKKDDQKEQLDLQVGLTQILTPTTLAQVNFVHSRAAGYMSNPYKIISVVNAMTGSTGDYDSLYEYRPRERDINTFHTQINQAIGNSVVYLSYRYFQDDWDIKAHTFEIKLRQPLTNSLYIQPSVRYYEQSAASFYRSMLTNVEAANLPKYASADYRLAKLNTLSLGIKLGYKFSFGGELAARAVYIKQDGDERPGDAVGIQRAEGVFPELRARFIDLSFTMPF